MATHLREDIAAQSAADICGAIAAGLDSDPATKLLAPLWDGLSVKGDGLAAARRAAERALGRARAKLNVADASWDAEAAAFGRDVVNETDGRRDRPPYTRFFVDVTPSDAQTFGVEREVSLGRSWVKELGRDPTEALSTKWTPRLGNATEKLAEASKQRKEGLDVVALQGTSEVLYVGEINLEIDKLEGALMQIFPGQPKKVAAFLSPTKPRRKRSEEEEEAGTEGG